MAELLLGIPMEDKFASMKHNQTHTHQHGAIKGHTICEDWRFLSYKSAISTIYQDAVRTAIESSSSKLLNGRPLPIATAKQTLPRKTRTILAQQHTGHS